MGLGRLEPEARNGPETTEDRPQADRRSTTDLTLIRRWGKPLDPGKLLGYQGFGRWIAGVGKRECRTLAGLVDTE
jgi:hypothetical protein